MTREHAADADRRRRDQEAGQRRPEHPGQVHVRVVQRDRVGRSSTDQVGDARLPGRHVEGEAGALHERDREQVPELDLAAVDQRRVDQRADPDRGLGEGQDRAAGTRSATTPPTSESVSIGTPQASPISPRAVAEPEIWLGQVAERAAMPICMGGACARAR